MRMEGDRRLSLVVGGFILVSLGLLALAIVLLSSGTGVFTPQYRLVAGFGNVQGLQPGAPVWLAGKEVGRVDRVDFSTAVDGSPVRVVLRVETSVRDRVRQDSIARIGTIGLLGDSYVEITVGSAEAPILADGDAIGVVDPASINDVIATGTQALDNIARLASNLNGMVETFSESSGGARIGHALDAATDIILQVQEGSGLLHSVVYDDYRSGGLEGIGKSLETLEHILTEVRDGDGILHALIYESPAEQDLIVKSLEAGARLNSILSKVDQGQGTIGLMLNDPTLYEDLKLLLGGAQRSTVMRSLIRMAVDNAEE
jgi:phospholipid/cholesterol/gamma-HCH transport system substrate-binding protein